MKYLFLFFPAWLSAQTGLLDLYRHLHSHPELAMEEWRTSARMQQEFSAAGFRVVAPIGGTGFAAILENGPGPVLLYRFDMDALPIREATGAAYASQEFTPGGPSDTIWRSHACGHDIHMAVSLGAARVLAQRRKEWRGTLVVIGQPAEETSQGAVKMLNDSLWHRVPKPQYLMALHAHAGLPAGTVGMIAGPAMARVTNLDIEVYGKSAHAGYSFQGIDANVLLARIVLALQTIVSREVPAIEPTVITIGRIEGGTVRNQVAERGNLKLTIRTYSEKLAEAVVEKIQRQCDGEAYAMGLPPDRYPKITRIGVATPEVINSTEFTARLSQIFEKALGAENVRKADPVMPGEDFSRYGRSLPGVPSCLFWLGTVEPAKYERAMQLGETLPSLHSSLYLPDAEKSIETGVRALSAAFLNLMN